MGRKGIDIVGLQPAGAARRVIGYVRVSKEDGSQALSPETQAKVIQDYCRAINLGTPEIISEEKSAKNIKGRPEFTRILEMCRAGQVAHVVVQDMTRLFREMRMGLNTLAEMEEDYKVSFHNAIRPYDTSTADGEFQRTLDLALGHRERRLIGERTKRVLRTTRLVSDKAAQASPAMLGKQRAGLLWCGSPPFGYQYGGGPKGKRKLVKDPRFYPVLLRMIQMHDQGVTAWKITNTLNREGVKPPKGRQFYDKRVSIIIGRRLIDEADLKTA